MKTVWTLEPERGSGYSKIWTEDREHDGTIPNHIIEWLSENGYKFSPVSLSVGRGKVLCVRVVDEHGNVVRA